MNTKKIEATLGIKDKNGYNLNAWYEHGIKSNPERFYSVITNDLDGLISENYIEEKFGIKLGGYYDFSESRVNSEISANKIPIFVDCDTNSQMCFGNHSTLFRNPLSLNLNNWQNKEYGKYAGSTFVTLLSFYEENIEDIPKEKMLFYFLIDGFYKQYFDFKDSWEYWIAFMGMYKYERLLEGYEKKDLDEMSSLYGTYKKLKLNDKQLLTWNGNIEAIRKDFGINITIPDIKFDTVKGNFIRYKGRYGEIPKEHCRRMFSNARTTLDEVRYSIFTKARVK